MFGAWGAHQKPSTAAKLPPDSKILGVVRPLSCISEGDSHNKLHILEGAGQKQGVTGLRLHWDHTQVQQVSGSKHPLQLHSRVGGSPPSPQPGHPRTCLAGQQGNRLDFGCHWYLKAHPPQLLTVTAWAVWPLNTTEKSHFLPDCECLTTYETYGCHCLPTPSEVCDL